MCTSQSRGPTIIHSSACLHDEGEEGGTRGNPFGSVRFIRGEEGGYRSGGKVGKYALLFRMTNGEIPPSRVLLLADSLATLHIFPFFISLAFIFPPRLRSRSFPFLSFFFSFLITFRLYRWRNHSIHLSREILSVINERREKSFAGIEILFFFYRRICNFSFNSSSFFFFFFLKEGFVLAIKGY